jgi:hypothetical protein
LIPDQTYDLFCCKASAQRCRQTTLAQQLNQQVQQSLQADPQIRFDKVVDAAQAHLATNNSRQAYQFLRNWCKTRKIKPPNPTPTDMDNLHNKYKELYTAVPPTAPPINTYVHYDIVNTAPKEIDEALSRLKPRKTPGASGIILEDLQNWHHRARIAETKSTPMEQNHQHHHNHVHHWTHTKLLLQYSTSPCTKVWKQRLPRHRIIRNHFIK